MKNKYPMHTGYLRLLKIFLLQLIILFSFSKIKAGDYYWVGGSGNWSNYANHWATTSGGLIFHIQIPGPLDNVFFDANSFSGVGQVVTIDSTLIYCYDMTWTGALFNPAFNFSSATLMIYGSLTLTANMTYGSGSSGIIYFESTSPGKTITSSGVTINARIYFNGIGGSWSLNDALSTGNGSSAQHISIFKGSFYTNNFPVTCGDFSINTSGTVDFGSSVIDCSPYHDFYDGGSGSVIASTSIIICSSFNGYTGRTYHDVNADNALYCDSSLFNDVTCGRIDGNGSSFNNVLFIAYTMQIYGNNTFHKATFLNGNANINGNCSFDTLFFNNPGNIVTLTSGTTQTINNAMIVDGSCTNWISFHSSAVGTQATISKTSGAVTVSYLLMSDINATGGASFTANNSVNMGNVTGWTINTPATQNLYWVGGTGNWNDANHWSVSSGGTGGACLPSPNDNIFFDANSFSSAGQTVSVNVPEAYFNDMTWTGALFNPAFNFSSATLMIYGSLTLTANMTYGSGSSGIIYFESTSPGKTITSSGVTINARIYFNGIGGSWSLNDALSTGNGSSAQHISIFKGSFYTNNFPVTCGDFSINTSGTVDFGSSVIDCSPYHDFYDGGSGSVIASTSIIICSSFNGYTGRTYHDVNADNALYCDSSLFNDVTCGRIDGNGSSFNNVLFIAYTMQIYGNNTFHKATFLNGNANINGNCSFDTLFFNNPGNIVTLTSGTTQTINNAMIVDGSCTNWISFHSSAVGTQATISKTSGAVTVSYLLMSDINATGGASFTANNSVNMGNVTGWTINTPATQNLYWVGGTGNWNDANHWSVSSGGTGGACLPSPNDNIFFDANSFSSAGQTVSVNVPEAYFNDMTWTGALFNPAFNFSSATLMIYGSLTLTANMTYGSGSSGIIYFESTSPGKTITSSGVTINARIYFNGIGGSWSLNDALSTGNGSSAQHISIFKGSFYTNNFPVTCGDFSINTSGTVDFGSSVIDCSPYHDFYDGGSGSVIASTSIIICSSFNGYTGRTYHDVNADNALYCDSSLFNDVTCGRIDGNGSSFNNVLFIAYTMQIYGNNTFHKATFLNGNANINGNCSFDTLFFNNPGNIVTLTSGTTQTINNALLENALPGFPISMHSYSMGSQATITKSSGNVCLNYFIMQDINATGGAQFYAGDYSVNLGNNTGWSFTSCAPAISNVWPGDANYNLTCDNMDILYIGVAYNDTGYVRSGANLTWTAQPALDWLSQFLTGQNAKHADCDGNGIVDANDTLAVSQNYGLIHPPRLASPGLALSGADLYFEMPPGNLVPGSNVSVPIRLGTPANPANNVYGIAFTINYDASLIQAGSMYMDYSTSWIATPANFIHLEKDFSAFGSFDMGLCRINHTNVSGNGIIATLHFTVASTASGWLTLSFSDVLAISANELPVPVNPLPSVVYTNVEEHASGETLSLYPNPVTDYLYFNTNNNPFERIEIFDRLGRKVIEANSNVKKIYLGNIASGIYLLSATDSENKKTIKLKFVKQ